jgi:hypothetical protein
VIRLRLDAVLLSCQVEFVAPDLLGSKEKFKKEVTALAKFNSSCFPCLFSSLGQFEEPIQAGQCADSDPAAVELSKRRIFVLQDRLKPVVLRRSADVLTATLPPRHEFVIWCALSPIQAE